MTALTVYNPSIIIVKEEVDQIVLVVVEGLAFLRLHVLNVTLGNDVLR